MTNTEASQTANISINLWMHTEEKILRYINHSMTILLLYQIDLPSIVSILIMHV